jgi:cyanophycin synthetase
LHMGAQGDLLLIFADALTRSWKQVTKFRPAGAEQVAVGVVGAKKDTTRDADNDSQRGAGLNEAALESAGFVRDERGLRFVKESDD